MPKQILLVEVQTDGMVFRTTNTIVPTVGHTIHNPGTLLIQGIRLDHTMVDAIQEILDRISSLFLSGLCSLVPVFSYSRVIQHMLGFCMTNLLPILLLL